MCIKEQILPHVCVYFNKRSPNILHSMLKGKVSQLLLLLCVPSAESFMKDLSAEAPVVVKQAIQAIKVAHAMEHAMAFHRQRDAWTFICLHVSSL